MPILESGSGLTAGRDFHAGYSPERIDPGNTTWSLENTPKVVSGIDAASLEAVEDFYGRIVERTVAVSGTREAELTKLLENTFRHVNIALVNELAMFAADLDIDVWEAIDAASTKPFGYLRFTPGPGVGGHCLPIDPSYLSWKVRRSLGQPFRFVELANDVNEHMPDYVVRRLMLALNRMGRSISGSRVLILGLAYKRNTGDAREAPGTVIARSLVALGADLRVADPHLDGDTLAFPLVEATAEELRAARRRGPGDRPRRLRLRPRDGQRPLRARHPQPPGRRRRRAALTSRCESSSPAAPGSSAPTSAGPLSPHPASTASSPSTTCPRGTRRTSTASTASTSSWGPSSTPTCSTRSSPAPTPWSTWRPARRCHGRSSTRSPPTRSTPPARSACSRRPATTGASTSWWRPPPRSTAPTRRCRSPRT